MATMKSRQPVVPRSSARRTHWRAVVAAHQRSGLSLAAFCRRRGLRKGTLGFWRWKFAHEARAIPRPGSPAFVPIQITPARAAPAVAGEGPPPVGEVEITLGPDPRVRVRGRVDPAWLGVVLRVVEASRC